MVTPSQSSSQKCSLIMKLHQGNGLDTVDRKVSNQSNKTKFNMFYEGDSSAIGNAPVDILGHIFLFLGINDLHSVQKICKIWETVVNSPPITRDWHLIHILKNHREKVLYIDSWTLDKVSVHDICDHVDEIHIKVSDSNFFQRSDLRKIILQFKHVYFEKAPKVKKLKVKGNLNFEGCSSLASLPENLEIDGSLNIDECSLKSLPKGLKLGDYLYIGLNNSLDFESIPEELSDRFLF